MNAAELAGIVAITAILVSYAAPSLIRQVERGKELSTLSKQEELSSAVREFYRENAFVLDSATDGTTLSFGSETLYLPKVDDTLDKHYTPIKSTLVQTVSLTAGESFCIKDNFPNLDTKLSPVYADAFGDCFLLYTTEQKTAPDGIKYRDFYIVSAGKNRKVDFDGSNAGDDLVKVVSGYEVEKELLEETRKKLERIKASLENYFYTLYLNDPTRDVNQDYFLRRKTDGTELTKSLLDNSCLVAGEDPNTDECLVPLSRIAYDEDGDGSPDTNALLDFLGLTPDDLNDAWGNPILIDTASVNVRSPETGKIAPFTARLVANTPWGDKVEVVVRQKL